jgi:ABC-2 type transport system permease protein
MSTVAMAFRQMRYENKSFWRNPAAAFFTFAFPIMLLVIVNAVLGGGTVELGGRTVSRSNLYIPSIAAFAVISACFTNTAMSVCFAREQGVLKRKLGTPLPQAAYLGGRVLHSTLVEVLLVAIVVGAGTLLYGAEAPTRSLPAFALTLVVGALSFCSLGLAITAAVPNAHSAPAIVNGIVLPLLFVSFARDTAPDLLRGFADLLPIRHYLEAMLFSFHGPEGAGGPAWSHLGVVAAWGVAGGLLAARYFRWEPRR